MVIVKARYCVFITFTCRFIFTISLERGNFLFHTFHAAFSLTMTYQHLYKKKSYASLLEILNTCLVCKKGYNGTNCETRCPYPSYGLGCQKQCNCIDKDCDHVSGCMQSAKGNPLCL